MKHLINRRSLILFLVGSAILIALTAFLVGYTDGKVSLLSPFLIIPTAGLAALLFETSMQRRAK
jgi:hypothetical protein